MLINKQHWISLGCISGRKWTEGLFEQTTVYLLLLLSSRPATYIKLLNNLPMIMNFNIFILSFIAHRDLSQNEISELPGFIFSGLKSLKTL